jgi:hypothetical protein
MIILYSFNDDYARLKYIMAALVQFTRGRQEYRKKDIFKKGF